MRTVLPILASLFLSSTAFAQAPAKAPAAAKAAPAAPAAAAAPKAPKAPPAKPKLAADIEKLDIGDVKAGETKDLTFNLKNDGTGDAKNVSCKASGFTFDQSKVTIAAGGSQAFKATYKAAPKAGKKDKPIKATVVCGTVKIPAAGTLKAAEAAPPPAK